VLGVGRRRRMARRGGAGSVPGSRVLQSSMGVSRLELVAATSFPALYLLGVCSEIDGPLSSLHTSDWLQ